MDEQTLLPLVEHDGERYPITLADLDEEVRAGRLPVHATVLHAPWTDAEFVRIDRIPQLAAALDAPSARLTAHLDRRPLPVAALNLAGLILLACIFQQLAQIAGGGPRLDRLISMGAAGLEPTLLDGGWWTAWSSQFIHAPGFPLAHVLVNLPILGLCGWRVQRALGLGGFAVVCVASVAVGGFAVSVFSAAPVVGSSTLAFGLFAAQVAIGLRLGDTLPARWRGRYGWATFKWLVLLFVNGFAAPGISHLAHVGGLVGGGLAGFFVPLETAAPAGRTRHRLALNLGLATALSVVGAAPALLASWVPEVLLGPHQRVDYAQASASLEVPTRTAGFRVGGRGLDGWLPSAHSTQPIFLTTWHMESAEPLPADQVAAYWEDLIDGTAAEIGAPAPIGPGWRVHAYEVAVEDADASRWLTRGAPILRVVEHQHQQGRRVVRLGYLLQVYAPDQAPAPRERVYDHIVRTVELNEPASLIEARARYDRNPESPARAHEYAAELAHLGRVDEPLAVLGPLHDREDGWQHDAARLALAMWVDAGAQADPRFGGTAWVERILAHTHLADPEMNRSGAAYLAAHGACATLRAHADRAHALRTSAVDRGEAPSAEDDQLIAAIDAWAAGCADPP